MFNGFVEQLIILVGENGFGNLEKLENLEKGVV